MGQASSRLNIADEIEGYLEDGLTPAQMAKLLRKLVSQIRDEERRAEADARRRAMDANRSRRYRASRVASRVASRDNHGDNHVDNPVIITQSSRDNHAPEAPANPLKVSRNFPSSTREDKKEDSKKEDKTILFGTVDKSTVPQRAARPPVTGTFEEVPTASGTVISFPTPPPPSSTAPPKNPRSALFALAKAIIPKGSGSAVAKLLKLHHDDIAAVARVLDAAGKAVEPTPYVWRTIKRLENFAKQDELDRQQIAEWRPVKPAFPPRDHGHPRQPYFILSKVDNRKKLYLDTSRVHELVYAKADEMGVVL